MDSINTLKGYAHVEDQSIHPKKRKINIFTVSIVILATVILCLATTILIHMNNTESKLTTKTNSIRAVCSFTHYPQSCISSLQSSNTADPEELLKLSLKTSLLQLSNLSSLPQDVILKVNDPRVKSALLDCQTLFVDAVDGVNASISSMEVVGQLSVSKIDDIKTWLSGATTNLETCLDGLDEMNSGVHDEMKTAMKNSTECTSNSLAIVANIQSIFDDLHIPMH